MLTKLVTTIVVLGLVSVAGTSANRQEVITVNDPGSLEYPCGYQKYPNAPVTLTIRTNNSTGSKRASVKTVNPTTGEEETLGGLYLPNGGVIDVGSCWEFLGSFSGSKYTYEYYECMIGGDSCNVASVPY